MPSFTELSKLPYLRACIRESLRFDPSVVSYLPRYVKPGGLQLPHAAGYIPNGTEIGSSPYVIGQNTNLYGPDADVYRPERFLENPEWAENVLKCEFSWGYGSRRCLGKNLAMFILYKVIFEVREFILPFSTCSSLT